MPVCRISTRKLKLCHRTLRSEERRMFSAASVCLFVCLFVCQHDNFRTSKHRTMKLGDSRCIVQKSRPSSNLWVITPSVRPPQMCVGLRRWENQRRLCSYRCLIHCTIINDLLTKDNLLGADEKCSWSASCQSDTADDKKMRL